MMPNPSTMFSGERRTTGHMPDLPEPFIPKASGMPTGNISSAAMVTRPPQSPETRGLSTGRVSRATCIASTGSQANRSLFSPSPARANRPNDLTGTPRSWSAHTTRPGSIQPPTAYGDPIIAEIAGQACRAI